MKKIFAASALAIAGLSVLPLAAAPAAAQSRTGIAVADVEAAVRMSNAMTVATQQIQTTYKAQIDQYNARATTLQAEVDVLTARLREEAAKATPNQTTLQNINKERTDKAQAAQRELGEIEAPYALAANYAQEQIQLRLRDAVKAATAAKRVDLLLTPDVVLDRADSVDITDAVVAELNRIVPNVSIAVPQGYQPGQLIQNAARAAQAAAAPAPAGSAPTTR
ncbi:MAG TPA: OmpH family outer membrane protein [Sphingopyxis sp.]|nr:OmpH family outer membrane protein [Sphingopyxis sp.]HMP44210.1 OmpH family outer membrane protein [Sphingopyxis sp.]HMQ19547.1 OmpH family outer membrane protein [Sphingopyxis sp.]